MLFVLLLAAPLISPGVAAAEPLNSPPAPPVALSEARSNGEEVVAVEITTSDRLQLKGDFYEPRLRSSRAPAALLVHDAGADRTQLVKIAERLQKQGFAVLALDLRGHGESATEEWNWEKADDEGKQNLWAFAPRDLEAGAAWLRENHAVHAANLSMVGVRAGCTLAVRHALRDDNVRSLGLVSPPGDAFGFDLRHDIQELEGLPMTMFITKAERERVEQIVEETHGETGTEYIEVSVLRTKSEDGLEDSKLAMNMSKWVADKAFPRRGD